MIGIHPVHRRLAEIHLLAQRLGGYQHLPEMAQIELRYCMAVNADLVVRLDSLKNLAFHAHEMSDVEWEQEICRQIDELEVKMI